MCGIAGQISADPHKIAANYPAYCRMQKSLARRGPDQRGIYLHGHAALIHARLAVVALENGCQPWRTQLSYQKLLPLPSVTQKLVKAPLFLSLIHI